MSIPIVYHGRRFPSRQALAEHLAPLLGRSVKALCTALSRYDGNITHVIDGPALSELSIPITYQDQQFPSRKALAEHLAPLLGKSVTSVQDALCHYNGNIERVLSVGNRPPLDRSIPIVYQGQQFPSRTALVDHLAPLLGKSRSTLQTLLSRYNGDIERILAEHTSAPARQTFRVERNRRIIECLRAGGSPPEIGREFGLTTETIRIIGLAAGAIRTDERAERNRRIADHLRAGVSLDALSREFGLNREVIRRIGHAEGVRPCPPGRPSARAEAGSPGFAQGPTQLGRGRPLG